MFYWSPNRFPRRSPSLFGLKSGTVTATVFSEPLLSLDASTNAIALATGITFTRSSTALVQDWEGIYRTAQANEARIQGARRVENLCKQSQALATAPWVAQLGATVTDNYAVAPGGSMTATRVTSGGNNFPVHQSSLFTGSLNGLTFTQSVWLKSSTGATQTAQITLTSEGSFDYVSGNLTITTSWQRFSFSKTFGSGDTGALRATLRRNTGGEDFDLLVWGMQVENVSGQASTAPGEYIPTTSSAVTKYFSTTNGNTVASNVVTEAAGVSLHPTRAVDGVTILDTYPIWTAGTVYAANARVIPTSGSGPAGGDGYWYYASTGGTSHATTEPTWAAGPVSDGTAAWTRGGYYRIAGYLHEQAATALNTYSNDLSNAAWAKTDCAVGTDSVVCPDGITRTTVTLTASAGNATCLNAVTAGNAAYVYAVSLKRKTGTGTINITVNGGTSWTSVTLTTAWQRFQVTATVTNPSIGVRIVTSGDAIYMAQSNVAAGTFATSPIDTTTAAVTRAADSLTLPASVFSNTAGTLVADVQHALWSAAAGQVLGDGTEYVLGLATDVSGAKSYDGTNTVSGPAGTPAGTMRQAVRWASTALQLAANGTAETAGTYDTSFNLSSLIIGSSFNGLIKNFRIYLSDQGADAALAALSAKETS